MKIACAQTTPSYLDVEKSTHMIFDFMEKASRAGAKLVVFPELILSGYPNFRILDWEYRKLYNKAAVFSGGPEIDKISKKARELDVAIVLGFIERNEDFPEVIYDSSIVIDSDGGVLGTHRKISPFGAEKMIFKAGDARDIRVFDTFVGKIGIGLCFENLNPLYRRALTLLGEEIHCSLWVNSEDIRHIPDCSSRVAAIEGGVCVALSSQVTPKNSQNSLARGQTFLGGSGILNPWGIFISGPVYEKEDLIFAEVDPESWEVKKFQSRGVESRDDLLSLQVARDAYKPINIKKDDEFRSPTREKKKRNSAS